MAPGLADIEREHPSLLRLVESSGDPYLHVTIRDRSGGGTSIYLEAAAWVCPITRELIGDIGTLPRA
jgi:hypothetical protein